MKPIFEALKTYESLSKDQRDLLQTKTISATKPIRDWMAFLGQISVIDAKTDKALQANMTWLILSGIMMGLSFLATFILTFMVGTIFAILPLLIMIGAIVLMVKNFGWKKKLHGYDLNNYLRQFFFPMLEALRVKAGEHTRLSATLDFRVPQHHVTPTKDRYMNRDIKIYDITYLVSKVKLLDGAELGVGIAEKVKDMSYWKTSASGKRKHKRKYKVYTQLVVRLKLPKKKYELGDKRPEGIEWDSSDPDFLVLKYKHKSKQRQLDQILPVKVLFGAIEKMYALVEDKNPGDPPLPSTKEKPRRRPAEEEEFDDGDDLDDVIMTGIWLGHFDHYDYSSFDYEQSDWYDEGAGDIGVFDS